MIKLNTYAINKTEYSKLYNRSKTDEYKSFLA